MQQRPERMREIVRETVASCFVSFIPQEGLTVMAVELSSDLRLATIWISQLQRTQTYEEILKIVGAQTPKIQKALKQRVRTKFVPRMRFRIDTGKLHADKIDEILDRL
jgi:ribosome-binding factor A